MCDDVWPSRPPMFVKVCEHLGYALKPPCRCLDLHKSPPVLPSWGRGTRFALAFPFPLPPFSFYRALPVQERKRCQPQVSGIRSALCQQTRVECERKDGVLADRSEGFKRANLREREKCENWGKNSINQEEGRWEVDSKKESKLRASGSEAKEERDECISSRQKGESICDLWHIMGCTMHQSNPQRALTGLVRHLKSALWKQTQTLSHPLNPHQGTPQICKPFPTNDWLDFIWIHRALTGYTK